MLFTLFIASKYLNTKTAYICALYNSEYFPVCKWELVRNFTAKYLRLQRQKNRFMVIIPIQLWGLAREEPYNKLFKQDLKGNFTPNLSLRGWNGAQKQTFPPSHFFELIHLLKENSPLIQNLVLLGRSSGRKRKKFGCNSRFRSFEGK